MVFCNRFCISVTKPKEAAMFTFVTQILESLQTGDVYLFTVFFLYVWGRWALLTTLALRYRVFTEPYRASVSVIIPVASEPREIFEDVLRRIQSEIHRWRYSGPGDIRDSEVIVVINGPRNEDLEEVCKEFDIKWVWTPQRGKRNAIKVGVDMAIGEIIALVDSDTKWTGSTLAELMKPFSNSRVGGVTTHQEVFGPNRNLVTRFANWMEDIRSNTSFPALSTLGQVGCLPGRTIAFRASILRNAMPMFVEEYFPDLNIRFGRIVLRYLGLKIEVSDDRSLTNFTLKFGYRTVYQRSSVVYTDAPTKWGVFIKQQLRWARGSQLNTIKMFWWMLTHPRQAWLLLIVFTSDIVTPYLLTSIVLLAAYRMVNHIGGLSVLEGTIFQNTGILLAAAAIGAFVSIGIRQVGHFRRKLDDLVFLPAFVSILTVVMVPIRIWGFLTMWKVAKWGTRKDAIEGIERRVIVSSTPDKPEDQ